MNTVQSSHSLRWSVFESSSSSDHHPIAPAPHPSPAFATASPSRTSRSGTRGAGGHARRHLAHGRQGRDGCLRGMSGAGKTTLMGPRAALSRCQGGPDSSWMVTISAICPSLLCAPSWDRHQENLSLRRAPSATTSAMASPARASRTSGVPRVLAHPTSFIAPCPWDMRRRWAERGVKRRGGSASASR